MTKIRKRTVLVAAITLLVLMVPMLVLVLNRAVYPGHDSWLHVQWSTEFLKQFWAGDLYPRWLVEIDGGAGSPVMFFYPPMAYLFVAPLYHLFPGDGLFYLRLNFANMFAILAAFSLMYLFLKDLSKDNIRAAIFGALLYVSLPYFYLIDIYIRGANSEIWSFACIPALLLGVVTLKINVLKGFLLVSVGTFLLVCTHIVSSVFWLPIALAYLCIQNQSKATLILGCIAFIFGIGLSSAYWATALGYLHKLDPDSMYSIAKVSSSFIFKSGAITALIKDPLSFNSILVVILFSLAAQIAVYCGLISLRNKVVLFWLSVSVVVVFLVSSISITAWKIIPILYKIQFPWRLLGVLNFVCVCFFVLALIHNQNRRFITIPLLCVPILTAIVVSFSAGFLSLKNIESDRAISDYGQIVLERKAAVTRGEARLYYSKEYELVPRANLEETNHISVAELDNTNASFKVVKHDRDALVLDVDAPEGSVLTLRRQLFYGSELKLNGNGVSGDFHKKIVQFDLPPGNHLVELTLKKMPLEVLGYRLSIGFLIFFLFFSYWIKKNRHVFETRALRHSL